MPTDSTLSFKSEQKRAPLSTTQNKLMEDHSYLKGLV